MASTEEKRKAIDWIGEYPDTTGWKTRHLNAIRLPKGPEIAIVTLLKGWLDYADCHEATYGSRIGDDYMLGPEWAKIGAAIQGLLNGESGRLDRGTLSTIIVDTLKAEGFNPEEL